MQRIVQAEILDQLPASHPDAIASRRDLLKINQLMGNFRWIRLVLQGDRADHGNSYLELGAGDGALAKQLIKALPGGRYTALDFAPKPASWPDDAEWIRRDVLSLDSFEGFTHLIANLFLHHFQPHELRQLGGGIAASSIRRIVVCEPCRKARYKHLLRAGKWIGFNRVTLNDGCVSVEAGFRGDELPELLGLAPSKWKWTAEETFTGTYRMLALRR
jgi:hypothetical protein